MNATTTLPAGMSFIDCPMCDVAKAAGMTCPGCRGTGRAILDERPAPAPVETTEDRYARAVLAAAAAIDLVDAELRPIGHRLDRADLAVPELVSPSGYVEGERQ
jgi:hypothetical protein